MQLRVEANNRPRDGWAAFWQQGKRDELVRVTLVSDRCIAVGVEEGTAAALYLQATKLGHLSAS